MKNEYRCGLDELLKIFDEDVSAQDILSAKVLAEVSTIITKHRINMKMTQREFAEHMGITQGMVSKWESKNYNFSIKALAEIAVKLDLDFSVRMRETKVVCIPKTEERLYIDCSNQFDIGNAFCEIDDFTNIKVFSDNCNKNMKEFTLYN